MRIAFSKRTRFAPARPIWSLSEDMDMSIGPTCWLVAGVTSTRGQSSSPWQPIAMRPTVFSGFCVLTEQTRLTHSYWLCSLLGRWSELTM